MYTSAQTPVDTMAAATVTIIYLLASITVSHQYSKFAHYKHDYHVIPNAVDLDTVTFNKVISHQNITVVMFMHFLSSGPKQTEFARFAESTATQEEVLAATVGVIDEAEMNNWELAERFEISMDQLPLIKLFVRGREVVSTPATLNCDELRELVTKSTGMWIGRTGTVEYLDDLAIQFLQAKTDEEKEERIQEVRVYRDGRPVDDDKYKSASYYLRIMEEYMRRGVSFLGLEAGRLRAELGRHKLHKGNKCGIQKQQNILQTFQRTKVHQPHDEL